MLAVIVGVGYASHHAIAGVIVAAAYLIVGAGFGRWGRARIRERVMAKGSVRFIAEGYAVLGLILVAAIVVWIVVRAA